MPDTPAIYGILPVQAGGAADEHPISKPTLDIGRSSENDVALLDDAQVSRRHVRLTYTAQGFQVQDLGSAIGTQLNGRPLAARQSYPPRFGDVLQIARFQLSLRPAAAPAPPWLSAKSRVPARPPPGPAVLL